MTRDHPWDRGIVQALHDRRRVRHQHGEGQAEQISRRNSDEVTLAADRAGDRSEQLPIKGIGPVDRIRRYLVGFYRPSQLAHETPHRGSRQPDVVDLDAVPIDQESDPAGGTDEDMRQGLVRAEPLLYFHGRNGLEQDQLIVAGRGRLNLEIERPDPGADLIPAALELLANRA